MNRFWRDSGLLGRLLDRYVGGHMTVGPVTFYGRNAMHYAINVETRFGYVCVRPPLTCFGVWWPVYAYVSENATPWHHTARGIGAEPDDCVCDECFANGQGRYRHPGERLYREQLESVS